MVFLESYTEVPKKELLRSLWLDPKPCEFELRERKPRSDEFGAPHPSVSCRFGTWVVL